MRLRLPGAAGLAAWRARLLRRWLDRRVPPEPARIVLHRRRLFILPTALGYTFAVTLGLLLIGSLNYGTSLGFVVTFLLAGGGTLGMLHTYRNLEGLELTFAPAAAVFAGETARFPVRVEAGGRPRWALSLRPAGLAPIDFHLGDEAPALLYLPCPASRRGRLTPARARVATRWPLELFQTWSWVHPRVTALVYPRPRDHGHALPESGGTGEQTRRRPGDEEFSGLRDYQAGDPPRRIAWRVLARTGELHTKAFDATPTGERWLDWDDLRELDGESRLEQLCFWVLAIDQVQGRYGLRLGGERFGPGSGPEHRRRCLEALALFGLPPELAA